MLVVIIYRLVVCKGINKGTTPITKNSFQAQNVAYSFVEKIVPAYLFVLLSMPGIG